MKRKRFDRDGWGFQYFPYYQMRIDTEMFHGLACVIQLTDGEYCYWDVPVAGKIPVCGGGMVWLQLIPDGRHHVVTAKYVPEPKTLKGVEYPYSVSVWYVDMIERIEYDEDGVAVFVDKYLDLIFTPQGDLLVDDRDELDAALESGELTREQYEDALRECEQVREELCSDLTKTEIFCSELLKIVDDRIGAGEKPFKRISGQKRGKEMHSRV